MTTFQHGRAPMVDAPRPKPLPVYDEVAAKRVEHQLVELGAKYTEELLAMAELESALGEAKCRELLLRMKQRVHDSEADLARLMCEAKKQLRGSDD